MGGQCRQRPSRIRHYTRPVRSLDAAPAQAAPLARLTAAAQSVSPGAVVLAAAFPILFLHVRYQPSVSLPLGGTFKLQDAAVLAVAAAAAAALRGDGARLLRPALAVWIPAALFLSWVLAATFYPLAADTPYAWRTHLVTAGEYVEYALLAPSVPLLVRRRADAVLVLGTLGAWAGFATVVGIAQFAGIGLLGAWPAGRRQPSFVGSHEFGALSAAVLGIGGVGLLWHAAERRARRALWAAVAVGLVGLLLDASAAAIAGLVPAALTAGAVAARRRLVGRRWIAAALATVILACAGVAAFRGKDVHQFLRFAGLQATQPSTSGDVQTYSQRTVLAYVGIQVWRSHPVVGAGWQATTEPATVDPVLPAARRRFPDVAPLAFPTAQHEYGVQLAYVQALADLGAVGLVLLVCLLAAPLALGLRTALRAPSGPAGAAALGVFWLLLVCGLFLGVGLVAGIPTDALLWLAIGAIGSAVAQSRRAAMMSQP